MDTILLHEEREGRVFLSSHQLRGSDTLQLQGMGDSSPGPGELEVSGMGSIFIIHRTAQGGAAGSPCSCTRPGKLSLHPASPRDLRDGSLHGGEIPRNVPVAMGR